MPDGLLRVIATGSASSYSSSERTGRGRPDRGQRLVLVGGLGAVNPCTCTAGGQRAGRVQERFGTDVGDPTREQRDELTLDIGRVAGTGRRRHQPGGQGLDEVVVGAHCSEVERQIGVVGRPRGLVADVAKTHDLSLRSGVVSKLRY